MWGKPRDVEGECNAHLYIGDDYGDGVATMRCQLPDGHDGPPREQFQRNGKPVIVTWHNDERRIEDEVSFGPPIDATLGAFVEPSDAV